MKLAKYKKLKRLYDSNDLEKLLQDPDSVLFLKLLSISRKDLLIGFTKTLGLYVPKNKDDLIRQLISNSRSRELIDDFIKNQYR